MRGKWGGGARLSSVVAGLLAWLTSRTHFIHVTYVPRKLGVDVVLSCLSITKTWGSPVPSSHRMHRQYISNITAPLIASHHSSQLNYLLLDARGCPSLLLSSIPSFFFSPLLLQRRGGKEISTLQANSGVVAQRTLIKAARFHGVSHRPPSAVGSTRTVHSNQPPLPTTPATPWRD